MENTSSLQQTTPNGGVESQTSIDFILRELFTVLQRDNEFTASAILKLRKLKTLVDEGLITQDEYEAKKKEWLCSL